MDDEQKQAWDELARWINDATELAITGKADTLWQSIGQLSDEHARGLLLSRHPPPPIAIRGK